MSHEYIELEGVGNNRKEAFYDAVVAFVARNGTRYGLRSDYLGKRDAGPEDSSNGEWADGKPLCYGTVTAPLPPMKWVNEEGGRYTIPRADPTAPPEQWQQHWKFVVHFHV